MAEPTLYQRLGGIFAIAAVIDNFSDRLLSNPKIVDANPELHEWHTVTYRTRLPGLKWGRTLWVASLARGPFEYTGREMRDAHFDLRISPAVFDEVSRNLPTPLMTSRCLSAKGRGPGRLRWREGRGYGRLSAWGCQLPLALSRA
jgi:hemoglobin